MGFISIYIYKIYKNVAADNDENILYKRSSSILSHALDGQYKTAKTNGRIPMYNIILSRIQGVQTGILRFSR